MEIFYWLVFAALLALCVALEVTKGQRDRVVTSQAFEAFKNNYLVIYCFMMAGDWLQGPYVYALYQHYGYSHTEIGRLFVAGFASSMVFGTVVGSLADRHGRRNASITYCLAYILSCLTKHSPEYPVLMAGRVLGGIATSLLFSAFESWLIAEHCKRGFEQQWLSVTFSQAVFLGNGLVAILSGLLANTLVSDLRLGPVAPFDAAAVLLAVGMTGIMSTWGENYGDTNESKGLLAQFRSAAATIREDEKIFLLGAIQALFEASMYTFVFLWTPALAPASQRIPHGFIFASFMLACMIGSSLASRLLARAATAATTTPSSSSSSSASSASAPWASLVSSSTASLSQQLVQVEGYMQVVFLVAAAALSVPVFIHHLIEPAPPGATSITAAGQVQLVAFCVFEVCVGVFWPSLMAMRARYIPEEARATIMNCFRIPLNIFVCLMLSDVSAGAMTPMFAMCCAFLTTAAVLQRRLMLLTCKPGATHTGYALVDTGSKDPNMDSDQSSDL
ncbi:unnamed protein product [Closterium sp. NIES-64]|nr:unnamed protein product [Closterium sp. NIES-64]